MARLQLMMILLGAITAACEQSPPPFSVLTESKSPDGKWIADAITTQDSGAGQIGFHTTVYLKSLTGAKTQAPVLIFPNEISKDKGKIEVHFLWPDRTLEVLLSRLPTFDTQVTRYAGMEITVTQGIPEKHTLPTAKQLGDAFNSSDLKSARRLLADFHCNPKTLEQVASVRQAWHELGASSSTAVTQDHHVQAVMAECLIEGQPPNATTDPDIDSAVALLRSAVRSDNIIEALVGAQGLIHHGDHRDNQSIVDIAVREPKVTTFLATDLIYNCSPNAARTLQLMLAQAKDQMKDRLESAIKRNESQRRENCATSANESEADNDGK